MKRRNKYIKREIQLSDILAEEQKKFVFLEGCGDIGFYYSITVPYWGELQGTPLMEGDITLEYKAKEDVIYTDSFPAWFNIYSIDMREKRVVLFLSYTDFGKYFTPEAINDMLSLYEEYRKTGLENQPEIIKMLDGG